MIEDKEGSLIPPHFSSFCIKKIIAMPLIDATQKSDSPYKRLYGCGLNTSAKECYHGSENYYICASNEKDSRILVTAGPFVQHGRFDHRSTAGGAPLLGALHFGILICCRVFGRKGCRGKRHQWPIIKAFSIQKASQHV